MLNLGYVPVENHGSAVPIPYLLWDKIPLYLNQEIVWNYSAGVACKNYLSPRNEKILWYVKNPKEYTFHLDAIRDKNVKYPNSKKNGRLRVNTLGKNPSDVWEIAKVTTGYQRSAKERTPHPCQFPTDLIDRLVLGFSDHDSIVFDPFVGSGTTFISCLRTLSGQRDTRSEKSQFLPLFRCFPSAYVQYASIKRLAGTKIDFFPTL